MKKLTPIICAALVIALAASWLGAVIYPALMATLAGPAAITAIVVYGVIIVAVIVGVIIALVQRLKEIKGGEEDAASKY